MKRQTQQKKALGHRCPLDEKERGDFLRLQEPSKGRFESKFIDTYTVTSASVHDSPPLDGLLEERDKYQDLYADSAYTGEDQETTIEKYEMKNQVNEKGYGNKLLTREQKASNHKKSKTRARVEHVFGLMEQSLNGLCVMARATGISGLMNLTYNLFRYEQVVRLNILPLKKILNKWLGI